MAPPKKTIGFVKLQVPAGQANPAPPVGTALGPHGVNIMDFCKQFNSQTQNQPGMIIPVELTIYKDRSFSFITKTPPAAILLKKEVGLDKGSAVPHRDKVGGRRDRQIRRRRLAPRSVRTGSTSWISASSSTRRLRTSRE